MGLSPFLPIAGTALSSLAGNTIEAIANAPSFMDILQQTLGGSQATTADDGTANHQTLSEDELAQKLEQFAHKLQQKLAATSVDGTAPIEVKSDGRGGLILDNPHPDRTMIEQILADDPELQAEFQQLSTELAAISERHNPFQFHDAEELRLRLDPSGIQVSLG